MLQQLSNIIKSYSIYGIVIEYSNTFIQSYDGGASCMSRNGIWVSFSYNYRCSIDSRTIHNRKTGEIPNVFLSKNYIYL